MTITTAQPKAIINLSQNYQNSRYYLSFNNCSVFANLKAIGIKRITGIVSLTNLQYNMFRKTQIQAPT